MTVPSCRLLVPERNKMGDLFIGSPIVICAAGDFYAFVDGWRGRVIGFQGGLVTVLVKNPDGQEVTIFIPKDELKEDKP